MQRKSSADRDGEGQGGGHGDGGCEQQPRRRNRKTPDNASFSQHTTGKYCWMHGRCNQYSAEFTCKANEHKDTATREAK